MTWIWAGVEFGDICYMCVIINIFYYYHDQSHA
jgi:hypothetical protein